MLKRLLAFVSLLLVAVVFTAACGKGSPTAPKEPVYPGPAPLPPTTVQETWENPEAFFKKPRYDGEWAVYVPAGAVRVTMLSRNPGVGSHLYVGMNVEIRFRVEISPDAPVPPPSAYPSVWGVWVAVVDESGKHITSWPAQSGHGGDMMPGQVREFSVANTVLPNAPHLFHGRPDAPQFQVRAGPYQGLRLYSWWPGRMWTTDPQYDRNGCPMDTTKCDMIPHPTFALGWRVQP